MSAYDEIDSLKEQVKSYRLENEELRRENDALAKQNDDLLADADQYNEKLIGALKKKINSIQEAMNLREREFEEQINSWKRKFNEAHRENNILHKKIRDLEMNRFEGADIQDIKAELASKNEEIRLLSNQKLTIESKASLLENKLQEIATRIKQGKKINMAILNSSNQGGDGGRTTQVENRGLLRKTRRSRDFRLSQNSFSSRRSFSNDSQAGDGELASDPKDTQLIQKLKKEKEILEKIEIDLTNKLMEIMKKAKEEKEEALELQKINFVNELTILKKDKQTLEEESKTRINALEQDVNSLLRKLNDRENEVMKYGSVINKLNDELKIKEDPAKNALGIVNYLEKFSRYQTDFLETEVEKYKKQFKKIKDDALDKEYASKDIESKYNKLGNEVESLKQEIKNLQELVDFKDQELLIMEKVRIEQENYLAYVTLDQKKSERMNKLISHLNNQLNHYKVLYRRARHQDAINLNIDSTNARQIKDTEMKMLKDVKPNESGFLILCKNFNGALSVEERCTVLKKVVHKLIFYLDLE